MTNQTQPEYKSITIEEYYEKIDGDVYWLYRFPSKEGAWTKVKTPYKELPHISTMPSERCFDCARPGNFVFHSNQHSLLLCSNCYEKKFERT